MEVKWLGHSCFKITHRGHSLVLDPFEPGSVPGLKDIHETADMVLCSHDHFDHNYSAAVTVSDHAEPEFFSVKKMTVCHDDKNGTLRGLSDIHLIEAAGYRMAHFGDIGCELTEEQKVQLQGLDLAMVPVGGYYTIDGAQAARLVRELNPAVTIPMHYSSDTYGFDEIGSVSAFTKFFDQSEVNSIGNDTISIEKGMRQQVAVLAYDGR